MEAEELPVENVCRACLCSVENSLEASEEQERVNFVDLLNKTFGKIISLSDDLPSRICLECQEIIRKSHEFKLKVLKSTRILLGGDDKEAEEEKNTPTLTVNFDDENFDSINLEDSIFDTPTNPLLNQVKQELSDADFDVTSDGNSDLVVIKSEDMVVNVNPFTGDEENAEKFKLHRCDQCSKCFSRATHLKRHKLTHEEGKIQCSICEKRFTRLDHLNLHVASNHSESKPFQCDVPECKKGFLRQEHLKKHIEAKHSEGAKDKEICEICQKTFASKKYLKIHAKSHNGEISKGLTCKYCNVEFAEKTELNEHMAKDHQNEKPYLCSECGLRFVRNDYLVIHMRRHMGVKPYKCRFCDKGFPRATDLTVHERYHTNEKTHLCNLCGKGFQRAYNLLVHMRVHTGEKPYQCSFCNKSFSQGNDLKAHIRRHTGERFKCDLCSEGFIQGYHLTHHKRTVHGLDVKSHIRRVEKFVTSSTANQDGDEKQDEEGVKMESEYSQFAEITN